MRLLCWVLLIQILKSELVTYFLKKSEKYNFVGHINSNLFDSMYSRAVLERENLKLK